MVAGFLGRRSLELGTLVHCGVAGRKVVEVVSGEETFAMGA